MNRLILRSFIPSILVFTFLNIAFFALITQLENWGFDVLVLAAGNLVVFLITAISYTMSAKGLQSKSNPAFFRLIYGSFFIKLVLLSAAAFIYIMTQKKNVNKPALFFCMGLYLVYTFIEVSSLMKISRKAR